MPIVICLTLGVGIITLCRLDRRKYLSDLKQKVRDNVEYTILSASDREDLTAMEWKDLYDTYERLNNG